MKKENTDLSRRNFLTKGGAAIVAGASIIAIPAASATNVSGATPMLTNDPVFTDDVQTLTNKTISSRKNTLGTDYVNIREYAITGTDITTALNSAIADLTNPAISPFIGGRILIPKGIWTTNGGHDLTDCVSIEGVGFNANHGWGGTEIKLNSGGSSFMFRIKAYARNISLRNFSINLKDKMTATGVWMTNVSAPGSFIYNTHIENFGIFGGTFGIKVDTAANTQFECILNRFERISFIGCLTAFYCNTINSGFDFHTCHFYVPKVNGSYPSGTAVELYVVGNISFNHCLFVGDGAGPNVPVTDGTTILKTYGAFNNISFTDCQDEGLEFAYQNFINAYQNNHWEIVSLVYRNCLIQSNFKFTAHGCVTMDSCRSSGTVFDSSTGLARLYLKGRWNFYTTPTVHSVDPLTSFVHPNSQVVYENLEIGAPVVKGPGVTGTQIINASRGAVNIASGTSYVQVYNNIITPNSLVFAQLRTHDAGSARIRHVFVDYGYFVIYLDKNASSELSVGFIVEG